MNFLAKSRQGLYALITFFILIFYCIPGEAQVVNGEINLYRVDFPGTIALDGEWEFYWNKLYHPYEIPQKKSYVKFPSLWNDIPYEEVNSQGVATYHLTLNFPKEKYDYALFVDDMYTAYRLFLNGREIASNGKVDKKPDEYQPRWLPQVVPLKQLSGEVTLTLQIANFRHAKGGATQSIILGDFETILTQFNTKKLYDIILAAFFFFLGVFFLIRFAMTFSGFESFYFALFAFVFAYNILATQFYVLHQWIDNLPWSVAIYFEYLSMFFSASFFALYVKYLYPVEAGKYPIPIFLGINAVYILIVLITPSTFFTGTISPYLYILLTYFFYAFTVFISAMGKKIKGATMGVVSTSVLFMAMSYSILEYLAVVPMWDALTFYGYGLFMFFQTLQLFQHETELEIRGA